MKTESRVVMLTDMKGFTAATSRQTREENARMLRLHDALLSPVIAAFGGQRVKSIGDAYLVLFAAPTEALLCAVAIQDRLADHAHRVVESERIEVRIALALGDVRLDGGDVFGEAVNLASRIEGEAESGEVWFSESVYWTLDRACVPVEEMGWRTLQGLKEEVRLFRVARAATAGPADPPYAHIGLGLVAGLPPPIPEKLLRARPRRRPAALGSGALVRLGVAAVVLVVAGAAGWWFSLPAAERWTRLGRFEAARQELDQLTAKRGADDGEVLYLHGLLELARADGAVGGSPRTAFHDWSRAVAVGNRAALSALARQGRSPECARRRQAARALGESRAIEALDALEEMSSAEPPAPPPEGALEKLKRAVAGDGRCGAGDLAREAAAAIAIATARPSPGR
jgi:class 3 adenylate cyclase